MNDYDQLTKYKLELGTDIIKVCETYFNIMQNDKISSSDAFGIISVALVSCITNLIKTFDLNGEHRKKVASLIAETIRSDD